MAWLPILACVLTCTTVFGAPPIFRGDSISRVELSEFATKLWGFDDNRNGTGDLVVDVGNYSGNSNADQSPNPFFTYVDADLLNTPTYQRFMKLLNNYDPYLERPETKTPEEEQEELEFLDEIMKTRVMTETLSFLIAKRYVTSATDLENKLKDMWFELYSRSTSYEALDSCGFAHTFVGEIDKSDKEVSGFHNWLSLMQKEQNGQVNYFGWVAITDPQLMAMKFTFNGYLKKYTGLWIGTSPEFEMAMYTVCFMARIDQICRFDLNGIETEIQTWTLATDSDNVGTAYPKVD
ncbi:PREDICTED: poly(U)-specific endoribonuclease-like [Priapulus caudatus]|uniref:Uridylate-specific endoribonuclease n=1 Tax=Priapulus caudatus TaxID=37621 RepID=A0ABM1E4N6_PRICU|nr:PREDICTED: poly(U)-specific endoribonuclease-like [Priapulus caudatus]